MRSIRNLPVLLAMAAIVALSVFAGGAYSADQPRQSANPKLDAVTIKAQRDRKALKRRVDHFVSSVIVTYGHDALARWDQPVCPLVAGLPRNMAEFILARISQVARAAHAPLAKEHCRANLYVIVTPYPDLLLKKWQARNPGMYRLCNGIAGVKAFMHSRRPIRVWYNILWVSEDGATASTPAPALSLPFFALPGGCVGAGSPAQGFAYVFIIVDLNQTKGLEIGQLADYVALTGLAQIRLGANPGSAPSILSLFSDPQHAPQGLSPWDQALLYALYTTRQSSPMEVPLISNSVMAKIAPTP